MRLSYFLIFCALCSIAFANGPAPPRNQQRRVGPGPRQFFNYGPGPSGPPPPPSIRSFHPSHYGPPPPRPPSHRHHHGGHHGGHHVHSHNLNHGYGATSYAFQSKGNSHGGGHSYGHAGKGSPTLGGIGLSALTAAFAPIDPPIVSVAPIIPYEPEPEHQGYSEPYQHQPIAPEPQPTFQSIVPQQFHYSKPEHSFPPEIPEPQGEGKISKSVYVFSAPSDPSDYVRPQVVKRFPQKRQKHYQVVFINAPNPPLQAQHTIELPPPPEVKTKVYVLVKKPQEAPPLKVIPSKVALNKPEVYFIRYKNKDNGGVTTVPSDAPITYGVEKEPEVHHQYQSHDEGHAHAAVGLDETPQYEGHSPSIEYGNEGPSSFGYATEGPSSGGYESEGFQPSGGYETHDSPHSSGGFEYGVPSHQFEDHSSSQFLDSGPEYGHGPPSHSYSDPYSDFSRLNAHYSTVTGRPVYFLTKALRKLKGKVGISRMDSNSNSSTETKDKWTPIPQSSRRRVKKELDADAEEFDGI